MFGKFIVFFFLTSRIKKKTYSCEVATSVLHFASCPASAVYATRITGAPHAGIRRLEVCNLFSVCPGSFGCSMRQIMSSPLPDFFLAFISGELFS
ncbi:hypothetical protein BDA99DRAFT_511640 [Phascolomyces articulosus]|uniref:Uncharacterized protein n=1 Tax=Phascolomyces articulosus TaxID=60185 RepID=A0AAD5PD66_9FUNG|nr:hypothetical protein BDA99DRAFT_511640 [Phascolomyces articulosus]